MTNCPSCGSQETRCGCTDQPFTCDRHGFMSWDRDTCPSCNDERMRRQRFSVGEYVRDELAASGWSTLDAAAKVADLGTDAAKLWIDMLCCDEMQTDHRIRFSEEEAAMLEQIFGISAATWLRIDATYRADSPPTKGSR